MNLQTNRQMGEPRQDRRALCEPADQAYSLITGQEALGELRRLIIDYAQAGPANKTHQAGPFHTLGTLSYASLTTLVNSLPREACLDLFKMEQNCRASAVAPGSLKKS